MSVPQVLAAYGAAVVAAGVTGVDAGVPSASPSLVTVPLVLGSLTALTGLVAATGSAVKGEAGYVRWMAAVHIGLLEPAALAVVYLYRAYRARAFANNALANAAMATLSASALLWLVALKPKKKTA